jgi:thiamine transport system substrate-binding protein
MFVFPVNPNAQLQPEFVNYLEVPSQTAVVSPADIAAHREEWIDAWTQTVLR